MSKIKLTNEFIDAALLKVGNNIQRIGNSKGYNYPLECKCLTCNHIWDPLAGQVIGYKSCPICKLERRAASERYDNNKIDDIFQKTNIRRIGDYFNAVTPLNWQCLICNKILFDTYHNVVKSDNCSDCSREKIARRRSLTNADIDNDLKINNPDVIRVGDYKNKRTKLDFKCNICAFEWPGWPQAVKNGRNGCPQCSCSKNEKRLLHYLTELEIDFIFQFKIKDKSRIFITDFYLPKYNMIIEYNGDQHYVPFGFGYVRPEYKINDEFLKQQERDEDLRRYCKKENINLLEIDGRKYKGSNLRAFIREYFRIYREIRKEMAKKVLSEKETRKNMLEIAAALGCEKDLLQIFAKYDNLLRNCTNPVEKQAIQVAGVEEIQFFLSSRPGYIMVNGKQVGKE